MTKVLVIGAGVSGLTSALRLAQAGHQVSIITKELPHDTVSAVAAAHWAPFLAQPVDKVVRWSKHTKKYFEKNIVPDNSSGVRPQKMTEFFDRSTEEPWWLDAVDSVRKLDKSELPDNYHAGFEISSVLIDTSVYLPWLVKQLAKAGVEVKQQTVRDFESVDAEHEVLVNCTGLGAATLCNDKMLFPVRGQVVHVEKLSKYNDVLADDTGHNSLFYAIPRIHDTVLGGTAQVNDWNTEVDPADTEEILNKAQQIVPDLAQAQVVGQKVGLRPARNQIRLELEIVSDRAVIHNYGHGGSGYTLSWGCAEEVLQLVENYK